MANKFLTVSYRLMNLQELQEVAQKCKVDLDGPVFKYVLDMFEWGWDQEGDPGSERHDIIADRRGRLCGGMSWVTMWETLCEHMGETDDGSCTNPKVERVFKKFFTE